MLEKPIVIVIQISAGAVLIVTAATAHAATTRVLCVVVAWAMVAGIETWLWMRKRATRETED